MPRALITGITGQDGSYLAERLLAEGWNVHGIVRGGRPTSLGGEGSAAPGEQPVAADVQVWDADLSDPEALDRTVAAATPDVVFNLGGISSVAASWDSPVLTARVTGESVVALLEACRRLQDRTGTAVRFLQASSSEIFGAAATAPQDESTPIAPVSPYGAAKAFAHHAVRVFRGRGVHAASVILYNHESPRRPESFVTRKITSGVARIARGLDDELVLGNLDVRRDWGWAPDYVDAMLRAAVADVADDYVIATGVDHSVRDFVDAALAAAGIPDFARIRVDPRFARPSDAPLMRGDAGRARERLGWAPTVGFDEVVRQMVEADLALLDGR